MHRPGFGGGLLTAARHELEPVLIHEGNEEAEILVIQVKVGLKNIRILNAYGPQEDVSLQKKLNFWQIMENLRISAYDEKCEIIIEICIKPFKKKSLL